MQKNLLIVSVVLCLTSNSWSAHLMAPENCIPCILAANSLRKAEDNALDTIIAITSEKNDDSIATRYILNMDQARKRANAAAIEAILKPEHIAASGSGSVNANAMAIPRNHEKQRQRQRQRHQDKRYINCEYATLPVRHARAADAREGQKGKRRAAAADLTLCHFKICNMGRKRNQRYFHSFNEYEN